MKKSARIIALVLSLVTLCLSLSSCDFIDKMRENQGFWNEDGSIKWNGETYKLLPKCEYFAPEVEGSDNVIYVTESDVPVLLTNFYGEDFLLSKNGIFLMNEDPLYVSTDIYCRSDKYDETVAYLKTPGILSEYCYIYYAYNDDNVYEERRYQLTESEKAAVTSVLKANPTKGTDENPEDYEYIIDLWLCSKDMLFMRDLNCSILIQKGGSYLLSVEKQDGDALSTYYYSVPDSMNATFDKLVSIYVED